MPKRKKTLSRRRFLSGVGGTLATITIASPNILGGTRTPPSEKLNMAFIGAGGRGASNLRALNDECNVIAFAEVDSRRASGSFQKYPEAKRFLDFRKMLDAVDSSIDAVVVSTPDHTHAVAAMAAIERSKHVYCEKPLAHSIHEVRALGAAARAKGVVTQMGNQGHSREDIRRLVEWVRGGVIGDVHTIHAGGSIVHTRIDDLPSLEEKHAIPKELDWDLWLGPALARDYHPLYLPSLWRAWRPFGGGTIGDWVCHVVDPSFWALDLGAPTTITALSVDDYDPRLHSDTFPRGSLIRFDFPEKGERGPVTLYWHDGTETLPQPRELEPGKEIKVGGILIGDKGTITHGSHGAGGVTLLPESRMENFTEPTPTIPRARGGHRRDWTRAIREGKKAGSDIPDYGGPLTEIALLGIIAQQFPGRPMTWDSERARFTDCDEANAYVSPPCREGWSV